jgi:hypothetical protein
LTGRAVTDTLHPMLSRPRARASGRAGSFLSLLLVAMLVVACGGSAPTSAPPASSPGAGTPTSSIGLPSPGLSGSGGPTSSSGGGTASSAPPASSAPSSSPQATTPGATPSGSEAPSPSSDAPCTSSTTNPTFFSTIAESVSWTVYCAVLPAGWYFQLGNYDLNGAGQMTVTYKGPGGVHLQLQEGAFCTGGESVCATHDSIIGPTAYGDQTGQLMTLVPGYVVYVSPGVPPSWAAASVDLPESTFVRLVADLHAVAKP